MSVSLSGPYANLLSFWEGGGGHSVASFTLNEATDSITFVWSQPEAATLTRVGVRQGSITGTAPTYRLSLQGVAGDGNEDGTIKGSGNCYVDYTPIAANNGKFFWLDLNQSYNASAGEMLSLVIRHQSGTINASNNAQFSITSAVGYGVIGLPYAIQNDNGSRSRPASAPLFGIGSATKAYGLPVGATSSGGTFSSPIERACRFQLPSSLLSSATVVGAKLNMIAPASGLADICLYDDSGTLLTSVTYDADMAQSNAVSRVYVIYLPTPVAITPGDWYRLSVKPSSGSWNLNFWEVADEADWDAWGWRGIVHGSERSGSGSWTNQLTRRYTIQPLLGAASPAGGNSAGKIIGG